MEMVPSKTSHGTGEVADGGVVERDAVFGEITKDGPNYRSVRLNRTNSQKNGEKSHEVLICCIGWLVRHNCPHDEDPVWFGRTLDASCI
jgi:hypothetical protein